MSALTIGAVLGDSDQASLVWARVIGSVSLQVAGLQQGVRSPVGLGIQFHVDGRIEPNQFVGVRTGRFSAARAHLVVQAAVPKSPVGDHRLVLLGMLDEAVLEAERFLRRKRVADTLPEITGLVARLRT